jgi:plastocyanin
MRKIGLVSTVVAVLVMMAVVGAVRARAPQPHNGEQNADAVKINIDNFSFAPQDVTVPVGATVTWVNRDDIPHTVVSESKKFKSKALDTDNTFAFTFKEAGTYEYYCSLHPKMTAKVTVK